MWNNECLILMGVFPPLPLNFECITFWHVYDLKQCVTYHPSAVFTTV